MQRQRGELVPIGEAFSDLSGPVGAVKLSGGRRQYGYGTKLSRSSFPA